MTFNVHDGFLKPLSQLYLLFLSTLISGHVQDHSLNRAARMVANGIRKDTRNNLNLQVFAENGISDAPADYDKAITATGFGTYNIILLLATIPVGWASAADLTTAAFYMSSADCDLQLTFIRNGALVSFVYIGMIASSFFWGFVTDTTRRKPLFILGLLVDAFCNILSSVVDSYHIFLLIKFITGTIVSGPFALLVPYLADFQPSTHRAKFVSWTEFIFSIGNVIPAILAFAILPQPWSITIFNRVFVSWRFFILASTIPSIIGLVTVSFLPESPKHLIAMGKTDKALELMKRIYSINTGKATDTFPIKSLMDEPKLVNEKSPTNFERMQEGWINFKALLRPPHRGQFFIIVFLQFGSMLAFNTMRLWVPHVFTIINNFNDTLWDYSERKPTLCELLEPVVLAPGLNDPEVIANNIVNCYEWRIEAFIYRNSTLIAGSIVSFGFFIVMYLDTRSKKKLVLITSFLIGTLCCFGANWGQVVPSMLTLCSTVAVTSRIASCIISAANAKLIPPPLRATATSFVTMTGSLGTIFGNLIFSTIISTTCIVAFMWLGSSLLLCLIVSLFALRSPPKPEESESIEEPKMVTKF